MPMKSNRLALGRRRLCVAAVVAIAALIGGTAYAASASLTIPRTDTIATLKNNTNLSPTGGAVTRILTVTLPQMPSATPYVVAAQGDLVNFGPADFVRCELRVNGIHIAAIATLIGSPSATGARGPAGAVTPFSLTGGATVPADGGSAVLQCGHDATNGARPYVDQSATVWVHRAQSLITFNERSS